MLKLRVIGDEKKDVWLVEPGLVIGSAVGVGMTLTGAGIKDKHAQVVVSGESITLKNLSGDAQLLVNGKSAGSEKPLKVGDEVTVAGIRLMVVDPKANYSAKPAANQEPAAAWSIRANHSALNNRIYPITGKMVLGRSNECDIVLSVTHLSRKHAELSVVGNKLVVKDLDSANGTFVNGKRIKEETLQKGDELRLDTLSFSVIGPADEMDKTSVRAAINPAILAAAAAANANKSANTASAVKTSKPTAAPARSAEPDSAKPAPATAAQSPASGSSAPASGGMNPMLIVGAVAAAAVIAAVVFFVL